MAVAVTVAVAVAVAVAVGLARDVGQREAACAAGAPPATPLARSPARRRAAPPAAPEPAAGAPASSGEADVPAGASRRSFSRSSLKWGWRSACRAERRSPGLYARSLLMSLMHSGEV